MLTQQPSIKTVCSEFHEYLADGLVVDDRKLIEWRTDVVSTETLLVLLCKERQTEVLLLNAILLKCQRMRLSMISVIKKDEVRRFSVKLSTPVMSQHLFFIVYTYKFTQRPCIIAYYYRKVAVSGPKHQGVWSDAIQPIFRTVSFFLSIAADRPATSLLTVHRCR